MKRTHHIAGLIGLVGLLLANAPCMSAQNQSSYDSAENHTICRGDSVVYNGQVFKTNGIYDVSYLREDGTDSIHRIVVNFAPSYSFHETKTIRDGEQFVWHGQTCTHTGTYYDQQQSIHGCDSTYELELQVVPYTPCSSPDTTRTIINISDQQTYHWSADGKTYSQSGTYFHVTKTNDGCDQVSVLQLNVWPSFRNDTAATVCQLDLPFYWHGQSYTAAGTYYDSHQTIHNYDSIYVLKLTVKPITYKSVTLRICEGQSITYNGKEYDHAGTYEDVTSCDKAYRITVEETQPQTFTTIAYFDGIKPYIWAHDGKQYAHAGIYKQSQPIAGTNCEDQYILDLRLAKKFESTEDITICEGDDFEWHGRQLGRTGIGETTTYYDSLKTRYGMDSVYVLHLTVGKKPVVIKQLNICQGGSITYDDVVYKEGGVFEYTKKTSLGCDSIVRVIVNVTNNYQRYDTVYLNAGESYQFYDQTISSSGDYFHSLGQENDCESLHSLHVIIRPATPKPFLHTEQITLCESELPYSWTGHNQVLTTSGIYYDSLKTKAPNAAFADSVYMLRLVVYPTYGKEKNIVENLYTCQAGGTIFYNGKEYTENDGITDEWVTLHTSHGCDSLVHLFLHFNQHFESHEYFNITNQETREWHGLTLNASGDYEVIETDEHGCDRIYYAHVTMEQKFIHKLDTTVCYYEVPFEWHGLTITQNVGTTTYQATEGEHQYIINVTVNPQYEEHRQFYVCPGSSISFRNKTYTEAARDTFYLKSTRSCDSLIIVDVYTTESYNVVETAYWREGQESYIWHGQTVNGPGLYMDNLKTKHDCDSVFKLVVSPLEWDSINRIQCANDTLEWYGRKLYQTGVFYEFEKDRLHRDSVMHVVNLKVNPIFDTIINIQGCRPGTLPMFNGKTYETTGTYYDTLQSVLTGCDSAFTIQATVYEPTRINYSDTICESQLPYNFAGEDIWAEGEYSGKREKNVCGCDSTTAVRLTILPSFTRNDSVIIGEGDTYYVGNKAIMAAHPEYKGQPISNDSVLYSCDGAYTFHVIVKQPYDSLIHLCEGDSVRFGHRWINYETARKEKIFYDSIPWQFEIPREKVLCDSVIRLTVETHPSYMTDTLAHINDKDSIYYNHRWLKAAGTYYDTVPTLQWGCDSIKRLTLIVDKTYFMRDSIHICMPHDKAYQYTWADGHLQSQKIWKEGTYRDSLRTNATKDLYEHYPREYRDSIYELVVTTEASYYFTRNYDLCEGDSVMLAGEWRKKAGIYVDTLKTATECHCDSIYQWNVNMTPSYRVHTDVHISNKDFPYTWVTDPQNRPDGKTLTAAGTYYDTLKSEINGCDSIISLTLSVHPTYYIEERDEVCASQLPYTWEKHNKSFSKAGIYYDSLRTVAGFDSIYVLNLQVLDTTHVYVSAKSCMGDSIEFNGRWLTKGGLYVDTLKKVNGCDSIVHFTYQQMSTYLRKQSAQTDDKTPYIWSVSGRTHTYTHSGIYRDTTKTAEGCDSIVELTLVVGKTYFFKDSLTICANQTPFEWRGRQLVESNTYIDSLQTKLGYDSVYQFKLTILPSFHTEYNITLCEGEKAFIKGEWQTKGGRYVDTLSSKINGCDSIVTTRLTFLPTYRYTNEVIIPQDSVLDFHGQRINREGTFYHYGKTEAGCDSIDIITVHHSRTYFFRDQAEICYEERPFLYHGRQYYESIKDTIRYKSSLGLDSLYELTLTVYDQIPQKTVNVNLCHGETFTYNNITVADRDGVYYDTIPSAFGCDSITKYIVRFYPAYNVYITDTICQGDYYELEPGKRLTNDGDYMARLKTVRQGCDSIVHLHLVVKPAKYEEENILITADQLPYRYRGVLYQQEGNYETITSGKAGCNDIYRFNLTITDKFSPWDTRYLCGNQDTIFLYGDTLTQPGQYQFPRRSASGLIDSLHRIEVVRATKYEYTEKRAICQGDSVVYGPYVYKTSGNFTMRFTSIYGCDSVINLQLTVNPRYETKERIIIPDYQSPFLWNDELYSEEGAYTANLTTTNGCDSICHMELTILPTDTLTEEATICDGEVYIWRGKDYHQGGVYVDTLFQPINSLSRIYILTLHVTEPIVITYLKETQEYCADDTQGYIDFQYKGNTPTLYSIYFSGKAHTAGLQDVVAVPYDEKAGVTFPIPEWDNGKYTLPGRYKAQLVLDNNDCKQTVHDFTVLMKYPAWIMEQNWNNTVSLLSAENNGGYEFSAYRWFINGDLQSGAIDAHLQDNNLRIGDQIVVELTRQGETETVPSCPFTITQASSTTITAILKVTPDEGGTAIRLRAGRNVRYRLVSPSGNLLMEGRLQQDAETRLPVPPASGLYFVWGLSEDGQSTTEKVIIQ